MRVLLIDPPYERFVGFRSEWFPLGIASVGAYLDEKGFEVAILHAEHSRETEYKSVVTYSRDFNKYKAAVEDDTHPVWHEIMETVKSFKPDVVGVSVITPKVPSALKIAGIVKKMSPRTVVVFGGHHPTIRAAEMLGHGAVDFVVRGEGEETFARLCELIARKKQDFASISGISFMKDGRQMDTPRRDLISDLNSLPLPGRELLIDAAHYTPTQMSMVMASRGCPFDCGFCATQNMWGRTVRLRSIKNCIKEIRFIKENYGVTHVNFMDDAFTVNRKQVEDFCHALIDSRLGITWSCLTRVDMIVPRLVAAMKKAGCRKVDVGIESGNTRVLKLIGKDITLQQVRDAARVLNGQNMFWSGFFMIGFPTETEKEIRDTLSFLKEIKPDWANISIFTPYPGTALYELAMERGGFSEYSSDYTLYSHQNIARRRTDVIPQERFAALAAGVLSEVHAYNSSLRCLFKRALTRDYHRNPLRLAGDVKKVMTWLKR